MAEISEAKDSENLYAELTLVHVLTNTTYGLKCVHKKYWLCLFLKICLFVLLGQKMPPDIFMFELMEWNQEIEAIIENISNRNAYPKWVQIMSVDGTANDRQMPSDCKYLANLIVNFFVLKHWPVFLIDLFVEWHGFLIAFSTFALQFKLSSKKWNIDQKADT